MNAVDNPIGRISKKTKMWIKFYNTQKRCQVENKIVHFLEKVENKIVHNIVKKILKIALHRSILLKADATSNGSFLPSFFLNRTEKSGFSVTVENLVSSSV
jgi:hypothetical protein